MKLTKEQINKLNDYLEFTSEYQDDKTARYQAIAHVFSNATPSEITTIKLAWDNYGRKEVEK